MGAGGQDAAPLADGLGRVEASKGMMIAFGLLLWLGLVCAAQAQDDGHRQTRQFARLAELVGQELGSAHETDAQPPSPRRAGVQGPLVQRVRTNSPREFDTRKARNTRFVLQTQIAPSLPDGFRIDLYALVPGARHMAVGDRVVFVGTRRSGRVWAVADRNQDQLADEVRRFAPHERFVLPNGVCLDRDGTLYVADLNRVVAFPRAESSYTQARPTTREVVSAGELIPTSEQAYNHGARVCRVNNGWLYIAIGQPYNVYPFGKMELYQSWGIGGIIRIALAGGHTRREICAIGIRNSVGMDFHPTSGDLWFTDNQVDGMGDDIPPGEINRLPTQSLRDCVPRGRVTTNHYGFPWYGGGFVRTHQYRRSSPPEGLIFPQIETVAHAADLGMVFYTGEMFPESYRRGIFSAQHGSWDRTTPVGARVMFASLSLDGSPEGTQISPFAEGWLDESTWRYLGRPVDVAVLPDGSLLVSDDLVGALYRIWYEGE